MSELYQLPDGWEWRDFISLTSLFCDGDWIESKDQSLNGIRLIQTGNIGIGIFKDREEKSRYISEEVFTRLNCTEIFEHDCLISRLPEPIGRSCLIPQHNYKMITSVDCTIVRFNHQIVPKFFVYYSQSSYYFRCIMKHSTGATRLRISKKNLSKIPIPTPLVVEQKRIVQKLDALFERIDNAIALLQKNIDAADSFMNSVLNDVFSNLEQNYNFKTLGCVSDIISGYAFKSDDFSTTNEIKSIKITNVGVGVFIEDDENKLPFGLLSKLSKFTVHENDIVIALTRPYISNGLKVCFVPSSYDGAFVNQRVAAIKSKYEITSNKYIYYYLCTSKILTNVIELSKTLNQPNLSIKDLAAFELPLAPLPVQQRVISYLDDLNIQISLVKSAQQQKMQNLLGLKSSILDQAFRGMI